MTSDPITTADHSTVSSIIPTTIPSTSTLPLPKTAHSHVWIITGPAGCGKSTVASHLASTWGIPYLEGDSFHPPENIQKMASGHPLTDADRWSWLAQMRDATASAALGAGAAVLTCSALKKTYRAVLRSPPSLPSASADSDMTNQGKGKEIKVHFVYLALDAEELVRRVEARKGHYMKAEMVRSQLEVLEEPDEEERGLDSFVVQAGREVGVVIGEVRGVFERVMGEDGLVA